MDGQRGGQAKVMEITGLTRGLERLLFDEQLLM
jgi:hypothetical protein